MHDYIDQYNFVTLYAIKLKVYLILLNIILLLLFFSLL